jgi:hypothetical protein
LRSILAEKEKDVSASSRKKQLTTEITSLLNNAVHEFNVLKEKIRQLESQVTSKTSNLEYEEIKEGFSKISRDLEEQKLKIMCWYRKTGSSRLILHKWKKNDRS